MFMMRESRGGSWLRAALISALIGLLAGCGSGDSPAGTSQEPSSAAPKDVIGVTRAEVATFDAPWAMDFLPDGRFLLTERGDAPTQGPGKLWLVTAAGSSVEVAGLPTNTGLFDVKVAPDYARTGMVYLSFFEPGGPDEPRRGRGAADMSFKPEGLSVLRATLSLTSAGASLENVAVVWRQEKLVPIGLNNQQGGYLAFSPDGRYLFITAGVRDEFTEVQDLDNALGKIIRIFPDGSIPADNPFVGVANARPDIWTYGHRNPYGLAFDPAGQLWEHENGPMGGDEFNLLIPGSNYGWPLASNGRSYGSATDDIPDHMPGDGFAAPAYTWYDSVAPSGMLFYHGSQFAAWNGDAVLGALRGEEIIRMKISGTTATVAQNIALGARIRTMREAPDGSLWVLEDAPSGRVVKLTPVLAS